MFPLKILPRHLLWKAIQCYAAASSFVITWNPWSLCMLKALKSCLSVLKSNSKLNNNQIMHIHSCMLVCTGFTRKVSRSFLLLVSYKALFLVIFPFPEPLQKEVQSMAFLEVISKLRSHENKTVAQQASLTEQRLAVESWGRSCFQCISSQISPLSSVLLVLLLCFPLYHLCMRVTFPHKLMNCCRYPSKKVSTNS